MYSKAQGNKVAVRKSISTVITSLALLLTTIALTACLSVKFIGDYDDTIDKGVTDLQQKTEQYIAKLNSNSNTPFDQSFYDSSTASLAVLQTRASALEKYDLISQEIAGLQSNFAQLQQLDKSTPRPIKIDRNGATAFTNAQSAIEVQVRAILKLELALKRGETPDGSKSSAK